MDGARTRGQPTALAAVASMLAGGLPHAILFAGPRGVGKTTLALDLAATLLCNEPDPADRPCRACRACRMLDGGNHPDLHRLAPSGPGAQIGIGGPDRPRGVRDLVGELALMPVEGGARVAIIEDAHRLNEDAQSALLKTLEEPPQGAVLLLCAEEEERLLPTVRSRCARVRLGPVGVREIEDLLGNLGAADAPRAAELARIAAGRPGLALAYARAPEAETARAEVARRLLDLLDGNAAMGLTATRDLLARSLDLARALEAGATTAGSRPARGRGGRRGAGPASTGARTAAGESVASSPTTVEATENAVAPPEDLPEVADDAAGTGRLPAHERRRAAVVLVRIWQDVARDLAVVALGVPGRARDFGLLDELEGAAARLVPDARSHPGAFLARLSRATELLEGNASPELVIDVLVLAWRRERAVSRPI